MKGRTARMHTHHAVQSALSGTRTEKNLLDAAKDEAFGSTKYALFAEAARKEGYPDIAALFERNAGREKAHAALWLGYLGELGSTAENLQSAVGSGQYGHAALLPEASETAAEEGFAEIAEKLRLTAGVEHRTSQSFEEALDAITDGSRFNGNVDTIWECRNCGAEYTGEAAPEHCPLCGFPRGYMQKKNVCMVRF